MEQTNKSKKRLEHRQAIKAKKMEFDERMENADYPHNCSQYEVLLVLQRRRDDAFDKMMDAKEEHTLQKALVEYSFCDNTLKALKDAMGLDPFERYEHDWDAYVAPQTAALVEPSITKNLV
jgi:hypothetical protein